MFLGCSDIVLVLNISLRANIQYGASIAASVKKAISKFSLEAATYRGRTVQRSAEVVDGMHLLKQPLGSSAYAKGFFQRKMKENSQDAEKLLDAVPDLQSALRLYSQCTLHKLPHLLGAEVMYTHTHQAPERWYKLVRLE